MTNHKTLRLLQSLDKKELQQFKKYLYQRYSKQKLAIRIFDYYQKRTSTFVKYSREPTFQLNYESIVGKVETKKGRKVFLNALSTLYSNLKDFLLEKTLKESSFEKDVLLLRIFQERQQEKEAQSLINSRLKKIAQIKAPTIWHIYQKMRLSHASYFNNYIKDAMKANRALNDTMSGLDEFYTTAKLALACEMENRANVLPVSFHIQLLEPIIQQLSPQIEKEQPLIAIYRLCLNLIQKHDEGDAKKLFQFLQDQVHKIPKEDQLIAYTYINNFMVQELKKGKEHFRLQLFELYKTGIKNEVYVHQGLLDSIVYTNTINLAAYFKAFDWARLFIKNYTPFLPSKIREDALHLSLANIAYAEKDFALALLQLNKVQFKDVFYALRSKSLILRCYYELQEDQQLILDFCKSFSTFVRDEQFFSKSSLKNYLTLIKYVRLFLRKKGRPPKKQLIINIQKEQHLLFRKWLIEKAEAIED